MVVLMRTVVVAVALLCMAGTATAASAIEEYDTSDGRELEEQQDNNKDEQNGGEGEEDEAVTIYLKLKNWWLSVFDDMNDDILFMIGVFLSSFGLLCLCRLCLFCFCPSGSRCGWRRRRRRRRRNRRCRSQEDNAAGNSEKRSRRGGSNTDDDTHPTRDETEISFEGGDDEDDDDDDISDDASVEAYIRSFDENPLAATDGIWLTSLGMEQKRRWMRNTKKEKTSDSRKAKVEECTAKADPSLV